MGNNISTVLGEEINHHF